MKAPARFLIVNADDFGLTSGVNRGIFEAHEHGIVTSASLMIRPSAASEAAAYARAHPALSVGLHFDLGEWRYDHGEWIEAYRVVNSADASAVSDELEWQLARFVELVGRDPSHLDSHQHAHRSEPARSFMRKIAERLGVPLRGYTNEIAFAGSFYGQTDEGETLPDGISAERLVRLIGALPPGWTEMSCHPGYANALDSVYRKEREEEIRVLRCREIRAALACAGVELRGFSDFRCER